MPKSRKHGSVPCQFFTWRIYQRDGVWWADGRSNEHDGGRHSLGTKDYAEALENLRRLDAKRAVAMNLADASVLLPASSKELDLERGRELYRQHVALPRIAGGASPSTWKRYRPVFDKFLPFLRKRHVRAWNHVTKEHLEAYASWLDGEHYAYRTQFLELTTIKQCIHWMIKAKHLPAECHIDMSLPKPSGTDTYCWRAEEVSAMIKQCGEHEDTRWLGKVLVALAYTGMRISELADLRWADIDFDIGMIRIKDETFSRRGTQDKRTKGALKKKIRQTKGRRDRSFPLHPDLHRVLETIERAADGVVFHGPLGGTLSPDIVRRALIRDVLTPLAERFPTCEGDVGFTDGRLHSFRHYFCSTCANHGVAEQMVMNWLGHQESKMVRHYYHAQREEAQRQMNRIQFISDAAATLA